MTADRIESGQFWFDLRWACRLLRLVLAVCLPLTAAGCSSERAEVVVFEDASLSPLFTELAGRFQRNHPGVAVRLQSTLGLEGVRRIRLGGTHCDLIALADEQLVPAFVFSKLAHRSYTFLGNQIVLATGRPDLLDGAKSQADWRDRWFELLFDEAHSFGTADPDHDPQGYFSRIVWKLAEVHYGRQGLYRKFLSRSRQIRESGESLVELLNSGELDFAFLFQSTALQNSLRFVRLAPEISLAEESYTDSYSRVFLQVAGLSPGSSFEVQGEPIRHVIVPLRDATPAAEQFLQFCLSDEAKAVAREMGYAPIATVEVTGADPR